MLTIHWIFFWQDGFGQCDQEIDPERLGSWIAMLRSDKDEFCVTRNSDGVTLAQSRNFNFWWVQIRESDHV